MKTNTIIGGVIYSTEQVEIKFTDGVKVTLIHCVETQLDKHCECSGDIFDGMLDYEMFRSYHDSFVKIEKKIEKDL
jgi:hypothetical protein